MNKNLLVSAAISMLLFFSCQEEEQKDVIESPYSTGFSLNNHYSLKNGYKGIVSVQSMKTKGEGPEVKRVIIDKGFRFEFRKKNDEPISTITANQGFFMLPFNGIDLFNGVLVENNEGYEVELDTLTWKKGADFVEGKGEIRIFSGGNIIICDDIKASPDFSSFEIKVVKGIMELEKEK